MRWRLHWRDNTKRDITGEDLSLDEHHPKYILYGDSIFLFHGWVGLSMIDKEARYWEINPDIIQRTECPNYIPGTYTGV